MLEWVVPCQSKCSTIPWRKIDIFGILGVWHANQGRTKYGIYNILRMQPKQDTRKEKSDIAYIQRVWWQGTRKINQALPYLKNAAQARYRKENP